MAFDDGGKPTKVCQLDWDARVPFVGILERGGDEVRLLIPAKELS